MIASVGSSMSGSGTVSTRTSRLPCQVSALMDRAFPPAGTRNEGSAGRRAEKQSGGAMAQRKVVHIFDRLWVVPLLCLLAGVLLAFATLAIDRGSDYGLVGQRLTGTPTAVQNVLSLIAQS